MTEPRGALEREPDEARADGGTDAPVRVPPIAGPRPSWPRRLRGWAALAVGAVALVAATLVIGGALDARWRLPELKPWHRFVPPSEVRAGDIDDRFTWDDYLAREARVFAEVRDEVENKLEPGDRIETNRYYAGSRAHPSRYPEDSNRTFELAPAAVRGGALLVHGLTDSPYSMRAIAHRLRDDGYYAVAMRMPGHGTVPAGLTTANWHDWLAAVRLGVRHVRARIGPDLPLVLVGYSNGGALVVEYSLEALDDTRPPRADRLVLVSPMIGVAPAARLSRAISALGFVPYFEKARWLDVIPEYNAFKYNSFAANAARQTFELTREIGRRITRAEEDGRLGQLPPVLTFQSAVDATVSTQAVIARLYESLPANGSELVMFDINRLAPLEPFVKPSVNVPVREMLAPRQRRFAATLVTNTTPESIDVRERRIPAASTAIVDRPLGLAWPDGVFSLSHVALPFTDDDQLYGLAVAPRRTGPIALGALTFRGERSVMNVSADDLTRIKSNPFFPYVAERISEWVGRAE